MVFSIHSLRASCDPARQHVAFFEEEVAATEKTKACTVIKWKCGFCEGTWSWSSWIRLRTHLSGVASIALSGGSSACPHVTDAVARGFKEQHAESVRQKHQKITLKRGAAAVNGANGGPRGPAPPQPDRRQKSIEAAFSTSGRELVDEKIANFFYGCKVSFMSADSVLFGEMVEALKTAPANYKAPYRQRFSYDLLEKTEKRIEAAKVGPFEALEVYGAAMAMDSATVNGEPISNYVLKVATVAKPIHLLLLNAKKHIANGECKDADYVAFGGVKAMNMAPEGGRWIVVALGDTAADEVLAAKMIATQKPWVSYVPCPLHLVHLIIELIAKIPEFAKWIEEGNEDALWFRGHHSTLALLNKYVPEHYPGTKTLRPMTSPDSRFGMCIFSRLRDLELRPVYQSVVADPRYLAENFSSDVVKPRILDEERWDRHFEYSKMMWPFLRLMKLGDSQKPTLSKLVGRVKQVEAHLTKMIDDYEEAGEYDLAEIARQIDIQKDEGGHWTKLRSQFAQAAYVLDPEFYESKPWSDEEARLALMEVTEKLLYPLEGDELDEKMREVERGYQVYFTKGGLFSKPHIWPRLKNGVAVGSDLMPAYAFFQSYGASMGPLAQGMAIKLTAQIGTEAIAERDFKNYKSNVDKRRTALGRERNDGTITAIRLQNVCANMHLEDFQTTALHEEEAHLRNFDLGDEQKWAARFVKTKAAESLLEVQLEPFKCYIEAFEDKSKHTLTAWNNRETHFKLKTKYVGKCLKDVGEDDDGSAYVDDRVIVGVTWAPRKGWKVETRLIDADDESDATEGYMINETLPPLIEAGKNPKYSMVLAP
jgi:hypothetical protein